MTLGQTSRYPQNTHTRIRNGDEKNPAGRALLCRMPTNQRYVLPGDAYHVTQRGTNRQDVFRQAGDRQDYLDLMRGQRQDADVRLLPYSLMTNHVHWVVTPEHRDSLGLLFRRGHGRYA